MTERYISITDDEYVYFLDTESEDYKTLEDFEKQEFETAKKDNIDIEEYEDAILQSANDKYWDYVYEYHAEADVVCDRLNEQDKRIKELTEENEQLKTQIKIFEMFLKENNLDIDWINFCGLDHLCIANDNDFECQYCPCLEFRECFDE